MDPGVLLGVLVTAVVSVVVLVVALGGARAGTASIGGLFRPPELGWPDGVQEDDDARWTWAGPGAGAESMGVPTARPEPVTGRIVSRRASARR